MSAKLGDEFGVGARAGELEKTGDAIGALRGRPLAKSPFRTLKLVVVAKPEKIGQRCKHRDIHTPRHVEQCRRVADQVAYMNDIGPQLAKQTLMEMPQGGLLVAVANAAVREKILVDRDNANAFMDIVFDNIPLARFAGQCRRHHDGFMPGRGQFFRKGQGIGLRAVEMAREKAMDVERYFHGTALAMLKRIFATPSSKETRADQPSSCRALAESSTETGTSNGRPGSRSTMIGLAKCF